jgi:hypothetical protein
MSGGAYNRLMRRTASVLLILLLTAPAQAWNKPTHQITAAISYDLLSKEPPDVAVKAVALLREHPEYATWANDLADIAEDQRDRWLFTMAARWPDDVRNNHKYHRGDWHYVNFPVQFEAGAKARTAGRA